MDATMLLLPASPRPSMLELAGLASLLERATPGPWDANARGFLIAPEVPKEGSRTFAGLCPNDTWTYYGGELICETINTPDAEAVAALRNLGPLLVAEIVRLRAELRAARRSR